MASESRITASRLGRLSLLGRLAGGIAGGMVAEGARQLGQGRRPSLGSLLLTPRNLERLGDRLAELRGAALKLGQLLSMDNGTLLSPELSELLTRLRSDADAMPLGQVGRQLDAAWGTGWQDRFQRFSFTPLAAASIGQVHEASLKDGRHLAVKIQYPGITTSIDSDVDNVATLLGLSGLLPPDMEIGPLLNEAKIQLHAEADYLQEARYLVEFAELIGQDDRFVVPGVVAELCTEQVLPMTFMRGESVERLADQETSLRNTVAANLLELALRELFEWGVVQTDPNFANYLFDCHTGQIQLLDFGATRHYNDITRHALRDLLGACMAGDYDDIIGAAQRVGYLGPDDPPAYRDAIFKLLTLATEPARVGGVFPFGQDDLAGKMRAVVLQMRIESKQARLPASEILYLHRKLGGLYLLLSRLRARIPVAELVQRVLAL